MESRHPPYYGQHPVHPPPQQYPEPSHNGVPHSPYRQERGDAPRFVPSGRLSPPPTPLAPPPPPQSHDRFYHQRRQTLESAPAPPPSQPSAHRAEHRPSLSYPPPFIPQNDPYRREGPGPDAREGYGLKRTHEQAMGEDVHANGRPDGRFVPDQHTAASPHRHQQAPHPHPPYSPYQPTGAPPPHPPQHLQHAPEHQPLGNGSMYHRESALVTHLADAASLMPVHAARSRSAAPPLSLANSCQATAPRSPPPPSPYSKRPMLPPGGPGSPPHHASPQYGHHQQSPLPPPPFSREPPPSSHRPGSGMSISAMLDHGPSRPPPDTRYQPHGPGGPPAMNGHGLFGERDGQRGPIYSQEQRSLTPDGYRSRHHEYTRPSRAYSGGEAHGRPVISPEKMSFGPPLHPLHENSHHMDGRGPLPPHNSAPQSRRASLSAPIPPPLDRPSTSQVPGSYSSHGPAAVDHIGVPRPPPPPLQGPADHEGRPLYGSQDRRAWPEPEPRPQYRDEPPSKINYPFFAQQQQQQQHQQPLPPAHLPPVPHPQSLPPPQQQHQHYQPEPLRAPEREPLHINGHGHPSNLPVHGPMPNPGPSASAPPAPEQGPRLPIPVDGRKLSVDQLQHGRLESPLQRHRHLMDRTNSAGSGRLSVGPDKRRAASPLPQAVQGAQAQPSGPASEPSIKGEFGRMFSGLGGVTPTPTPVELATKRYASPAAERDMDAERRGSGTPLAGRAELDKSGGGVTSRNGKRSRKARDDDGLSSPTLELARSLSGRGIKRSRNSYIGVDSTSPVLGRNDSGIPWAAGTARQRSFTPSSYAALSASKRAAQSDRERERAAERDRERDERKPRTIVSSKMVLDSVKNKPRKHLGSMLYDVKIAPERLGLGEEGSRFGYSSTPELLPSFEDKDNCTFTVRVGRRFLTPSYREEVVERRNLWGSEVYTDDSDVLAAAIHSGWIRGEWADDVDISMLSLNGRQQQQDDEYRPNGRSSLSVSVSPELSRKSLANGRGGSTNGTPSVSPSKDSGRRNKNSKSANSNSIEPDDDVMTAAPKTGPVVPPADRDAHITLLLLPRLQSYGSTFSCGIKSRAWGKSPDAAPHDGVSFMIHKIEWIDEGPASRKTERGAEARHRRIAQGIKDRMVGSVTGSSSSSSVRTSRFNLGGDLAKGMGKTNGINGKTQAVETGQAVAVGA